MDGWLLSLLIFTPLVGALVLLFVPGRHVDIHRWGAFGISLVAFAIALLIALSFDNERAGFQLVQEVDWIGFFGIQYKVGVDGISLWLVMLTTFIMPMAILGSYSYIKRQEPTYYAMLLLLMTAMIGVFIGLMITQSKFSIIMTGLGVMISFALRVLKRIKFLNITDSFFNMEPSS